MKRQLQTELDRDMIIGHIKRLDISKSYSVEVTEKKVKRTMSQNSLYWLWLTCIEFETGNNRDDLHDLFKDKYLNPIHFDLFGERRIKRSTTGLDTQQFTDYLNQIQIFASTELSITLPDPEDKKWEEFFSFYSDKI
jgi:hypothetical protein